MPKTRSDVDRDTKVEEILLVAERMVEAGGYEGLSVAAVARDVGIANSAVYWYFPSKDHLFVAVLRRMLHRVAAHKPPRARGLVAQARWVVDRLEEYEPLRSGLRRRAQASSEAAELQNEFEELLRALVEHGLAGSVAADELPVAVDALLALAEGLVARPLSRRRRDAVLQYAIERLTV